MLLQYTSCLLATPIHRCSFSVCFPFWQEPSFFPVMEDRFILLEHDKVPQYFTVDVQAKMCPDFTYQGPWSEWSSTAEWRTAGVLLHWFLILTFHKQEFLNHWVHISFFMIRLQKWLDIGSISCCPSFLSLASSYWVLHKKREYGDFFYPIKACFGLKPSSSAELPAELYPVKLVILDDEALLLASEETCKNEYIWTETTSYHRHKTCTSCLLSHSFLIHASIKLL